MSEAPPLMFTWQGDSFTPASRYWARQADKYYIIGTNYELVEHHARSTNSHRHYFAAVHQAWANLPENLAEQFPTETHLRKYCLIKAGFHNSNTLVCPSKASALATAAFVRPTDDFAVVVVKNNVITRYVAQSQSMRAMGNAAFQDSKSKVLDILAEMTGVTRKALEGSDPA